VRVRDVAHIELGAQQYDRLPLDGQPSVGPVFSVPGSNALEWPRHQAKMEER
jgi:multidrug efflux pump subunit AcrB